MDKSKIIEICCGSYEDALAAYRGGAKRIELNSALYLGGLTPTIASLQLTKKNTDLKVICMVRPRGGGFCYSDDDFEVMKSDAEIMMQNGADGLAFGFLINTPQGAGAPQGAGSPEHSANTPTGPQVDLKRTKALIDICHKYGGEAVFHRAFDLVADPFSAVQDLINLGAQRILTSGQKPKAWDGRGLLKALQENFGKEIEILAGSGINVTNALQLMEATGIDQVHSSCKAWKEDSTTAGTSVSFEYAPSPHEKDYEVVSEELVKGLQDLIS